MKSKWMRISMLPALALSLVLWSCDYAGEQDLLGPQVGASFDEGGNGFTVAKQKDLSVGTVSALVDASGGKLTLGKHELFIPKDAVSAPTTFTMSKLDGDHIAVSLTATQLTTNDIGSQGFNVPLKLSLSYEDASSLPADLSSMQIVWLKGDGTMEAQASEVLVTGKRVRGTLTHFSDYALAWPF